MGLRSLQRSLVEEGRPPPVVEAEHIVWAMDAHGDMTDHQSNTFWRTFTGQTKEEAQGRGWMKALHPEDRARVAATFAQAIETQSIYDAEYRLRREDGEYRVFSARGVPIMDRQGEIDGWVGSSLDITERRRMEEELRSKTAFLEAQVGHSLDGILVVDSHGKKLLQNRRMADLWGIPRHIADDPDDRPQLEFVINRVKNPEQFSEKVNHLNAHPEEVSRDEIELKNGRVLDRYSSPVIDAHGHYHGRIWQFHDITERKQAEEALRKAHEGMEQRVVDRTRELKTANEQLRQINRLFRILSECNEQVVRAASEANLLDEICRIIVELGGYPSVWIGFAEADERKTVRPVAQRGFEEGFLGTLSITWADNENGRGPAGTAIRTGRPCIVEDVQSDTNFAPWREDAKRRGYASAVGLPLSDNGRVFGALVIFATTPDAFHVREVEVLLELANDLVYGITSLRARAERREAQAQVNRLAELQSAMLNNTTHTVISTDAGGVITSVNPAGERALGYSAAECVGKLMPTVFHDPEELAERARIFTAELGVEIQAGFEVFAARARRQLPNEYEWHYRRKDGSLFPVLLSVTALRDPQGEIMGFLGIANDITARKRAEEELRQSRQELTEAQRIAKVGSWFWEPEPDVVVWSPEMYHVSGRDPTLPAPRYRELQTVYSPESMARLRPMVERALQTGAPYEVELEMVRPDGSRRTVTSRGEVQRDQSGRIVKVRGTVQDITERRLAEEALRVSEQKFETIFRASPVPLSVSERDTGRLIEINEALLRLMRATSFDQMVGHTSLEIGMISREERQKILDALAQSGHVDRLEVTGHRLDGEVLPAEVSLSQYEISGRHYLLVNIMDITARKRAEAEVQRLNADLEKRVAERTAELAAANRELETFSYSVSHDLRSPLRTIDGFSKLLQEDYADRLDAEGGQYLDYISTAARRMDHLIRGLLNLSHITRSPIEQRQVDLSALVKTIANELRESDPRRVAEFVIAPGLTATGDPDLLRSVLQNLLGNAWKYTGKHPRARIEFGARRAGGETAFYVRDDGAGFDPKHVDRLFGAFERLHGADEFPGTGIGLTTAQRIIQRHGGRIWAEGAVERGATFYFTIPGPKQE
jgi:PAS domain S-box-containing protein